MRDALCSDPARGPVFDVVLLTGHAFQTWLTAADRAAVLARSQIACPSLADLT